MGIVLIALAIVVDLTIIVLSPLIFVPQDLVGFVDFNKIGSLDLLLLAEGRVWMIFFG